MQKITWTDSFSVGVEIFDLQHQKIIDLVNHLQEIEELKFNKERIRSVLSDLVEYGYEHLQQEEAMLQKYDYPEFAQHKHEHMVYVNKVTNAIKNIVSMDEQRFIELIEFLNDWWTNHILKEDMAYKTFLNERGVS